MQSVATIKLLAVHSCFFVVLEPQRQSHLSVYRIVLLDLQRRLLGAWLIAWWKSRIERRQQLDMAASDQLIRFAVNRHARAFDRTDIAGSLHGLVWNPGVVGEVVFNVVHDDMRRFNRVNLIGRTNGITRDDAILQVLLDARRAW